MAVNNQGFKKILLLIIIGGALGNFHDRIQFNAVLDFIDFHVANFHWFIFNVSDIFITLGVTGMIILELTDNNKKTKMNKLLLFLTLVLFTISGCSTVKKHLILKEKMDQRNFWLKKAPLSMPPNFDELPIPKSQKTEEVEEVDDIQNLILSSENNEQNSSKKDNPSENNLEISILNQINKN